MRVSLEFSDDVCMMIWQLLLHQISSWAGLFGFVTVCIEARSEAARLDT